MKKLTAIALLFGLASCGPPTFYYDRATGVRVDADKSVFSKFTIAKTECSGEVAQSAMSMTTQSAYNAGYLFDTAMHGCMSKRGYDVGP